MAENPTNPSLMTRFNDLPPQNKLGLLGGFAVLIVLVISYMLWAQAPEYKVLFSNISDRDGGAVIESLQKLNIQFKTGEGGSISVPANQVYDARLKLAGLGLPRGGSTGFELMDGQHFGITQFQENVNYQRALEGELARTIQSISAVHAARIHLAIPKSTAFLAEDTKPSASVLLDLYTGKSLDKSQLGGIVNLVASSVPGLAADNVTLIDQSGKLLAGGATSASSASIGLNPSQLDYLRDIERDYSQRILAIVSPVTGPDNVRVQVTAELDFSVKEQTSEEYKPNPTPETSTVRSRQTNDSKSGGDSAGGVPGALTNQPPNNTVTPLSAPPVPPPPAPGSLNSAGVAGPAQSDSIINYEVNKTISHVKSEVGSIKRLSVAVLVNNKAVKDKKGTVTPEALRAEN